VTDKATSSRHQHKTTHSKRGTTPIDSRSYAARRTGQPTLVCAGDSITNGAISANWVDRVTRSAPLGRDIVNAGINGDLAWNLLSRLDEIIACRPAAVTVLIGTNDALAQISGDWSDRYVKSKRLPQPPTPQWYEDTLHRIVGRLTSETTAAVALMSLPPLGDAVEGRWHDLIAIYNTIIGAVAACADIPVLPVHERVAALITDAPRAAWDGTRKLMGTAVARRYLLRCSWDAIARYQGFATTTDGVHLNDRAAARIAELVERFADTAPWTPDPNSL
jgi:acyl-CoA thioesterase-1